MIRRPATTILTEKGSTGSRNSPPRCKEQTLKSGDYVNIPANLARWGVCPEECEFYLYVDGANTFNVVDELDSMKILTEFRGACDRHGDFQ